MQFFPRSWRGMRALPVRLAIHLLRPYWLYIWTRLRNSLWVKYLYPLCSCLCSAQSCFLCLWFNCGRAVTATCLTFLKVVALASSPVHSIAVWMLTLSKAVKHTFPTMLIFAIVTHKREQQTESVAWKYLCDLFDADSYFLIKPCGMLLAVSYLCCCYGSFIHTIIHINHMFGDL